MQIRDKYLDKQVFGEQNAQDNNEQLQKANEFFSRLPQVNLESEKVRCPKCNCLHKTYCLKCGELLIDKEYIPQIVLPIDLLIIHHEKEKHQKSSALPSQFLSKNVQIVNYPFKNKLQKNLYVLYPHQSARYVKDIPREELQNIKQIVAIDCTWYQTNQIIENLEDPKFIKLQDYETYFWRYQHHSLKCLATIEAIYYFYKEYAQQLDLPTSFDVLLFFYKYTFEMIKKDLKQENVYQKIETKKSRRLVQKELEKQQKKFQKAQ